jgi:hypothetical protein
MNALNIENALSIGAENNAGGVHHVSRSEQIIQIEKQIQKKITAADTWLKISQKRKNQLKTELNKKILNLIEEHLEFLEKWGEIEQAHQQKKLNAIEEMREWKRRYNV